MGVRVDNPTLGFEAWFDRYIKGTARERPGVAKTAYQKSYNAYKSSNDAFLLAKGQYDQSFAETNKTSNQLERGDGQALVNAVSASKIIRDFVTWVAKKGYGKKFPGSTAIQLADGNYTAEMAAWHIWWGHFNTFNAAEKHSADLKKSLKNEWSKVVEPIMRAHTKAEADRRGTLVAKLDTIRGLPSMVKQSARDRLIGLQFDKGAAAGYAEEYKGNLTRREVPGTGSAGTDLAGAAAGLNWPLILGVIVVLLVLGVGGYFVLRD